MHSLLKRFSIIHRQSNLYFNRDLKELDINTSQFQHILIICENPGISQERICSELRIDKGSVARTLKQLEQRNYIVRNISASNKCQYEIYITESGRRVYEQAKKIGDVFEDILTQNLTDIEKNILINLLDKLIEDLDHTKLL